MKKRPVHRSAPVATESDGAHPQLEVFPDAPPKSTGAAPEPPTFRTLKVFAFGPSLGRMPGNVMTIPVRYEKLRPGPVGERVAVIDYDATRDCFYDPVDLDHPFIAIPGGLEPSESDPHFHQQMAYAVTCETLRRVEAAFGRTLRRRTSGGSGELRLYVYPHAMRVQNSTTSPHDGKILLGYFRAPPEAAGRTIPGQTVFLCLVHDVIVHAAMHAILGAARPDLNGEELNEADRMDLDACMEGVADFAALLLHFSYREAVLDTIQRTAGSIHRSQMDRGTAAASALIQAEMAVGNPLLAMGSDFGDAIGRIGGIRSALGQEADPTALDRLQQPHDRGGILVAALFDTFFSVYVQRSLDLFRIYRAGGGRLSEGDLPAPLAERLFMETDAIARRLFDTCVRALDYCPPPPFALGDYLRACITADFVYAPTDPCGLRETLMYSFARRGMKPSTVSFFSEDALRWPQVDIGRLTMPGPALLGVADANPAKAQQNQTRVRTFVAENAAALGLDPGVDLVVYPLEASRFTTADGRVEGTLSTQVLQKRGKKTRGRGVSLVFDASGRLRYSIPSARRPR